jgi:C4-dicarboxylate-specific signal transduction histidine kinase
MNTKGIGLGLVISEKIVKEFGGKITLKSIPEPE